MKSHQKRKNERMYFIAVPSSLGRRCGLERMPPAAKRAHEDEGVEADEGDHGEDREVAARPFDAGALAAPEDPEAREQDPDDELERVLRHPGKGPPDDE